MKPITKAVKDAQRADGYLVMITTLKEKGDKLTHTYFMKNFRKADIMASLDEHSKNLESEAR